MITKLLHPPGIPAITLPARASLLLLLVALSARADVLEDLAAQLGQARPFEGTNVNVLTTNTPPMVTPLPGTNALVMPELNPSIDRVADDLICVWFNAKVRHLYFIEGSTNLSNWSACTPHFPAAGRVGWQLRATNAARFFRVQEGWWNGAEIVFTPVAVLTNSP